MAMMMMSAAAARSRAASSAGPQPRRRGDLSRCASTSRGREKDAWRANVPSRAPDQRGRGGGYYEEGPSGSAPPPPPRGGNPSPLSANFWLPGGESLRNRRMILTAGLVLGGSFFLRKLLPGSQEAPRVFVDDATGQRYLVTDGGNELALFEDDRGRPYFLDPKGNMWYVVSPTLSTSPPPPLSTPPFPFPSETLFNQGAGGRRAQKTKKKKG